MIKLKSGEHIKKKVRKHWFVLFERISVLAFIFLLPFIFYAIAASTSAGTTIRESLSFSFNTELLLFISALWAMLIWMKFAAVWTDYYLDIWIVTNQRIVDVEQLGFFHREISTLHTERIQDVTIKIRGFIATILGFGDIHVQTAGESREFIIRGIPDPQHVKEIILKQHDEALQRAK